MIVLFQAFILSSIIPEHLGPRQLQRWGNKNIKLFKRRCEENSSPSKPGGLDGGGQEGAAGETEHANSGVIKPQWGSFSTPVRSLKDT